MEGDTQGHVKRKSKTFYFVYPTPAIFVPDTEKCPSPWLIHLMLYSLELYGQFGRTDRQFT